MQTPEPWRDHPLSLQGKVELVPTAWVWQYRGADPSPYADVMDGTFVDAEMLWQDLLKTGMHMPFIMRVGLKNKKFRLEAGNHRIQLYYEHGVPMIPVAVQVKEECGPQAPDVMTEATHNFDAGDEFLISEITEEYMRPSEVFKSLQTIAMPGTAQAQGV